MPSAARVWRRRPAEVMEEVRLRCADGFVLCGTIFPVLAPRCGTVIVNPATGVKARYYHRYARFLAEQGFDALSYDYRGIGASRPARLRGSGIIWDDWGTLDFDAAVTWARERDPDGFLGVVGHSIGGFLIGLAPQAGRVDRILTVGAQYAWWRDYAAHRRAALVLRWHVAMPVLTTICGMFPGGRLGWLEDLPKGVAHQWSFRGADLRPALAARLANVRAPILAVAATDDEFATDAALLRTLRYYRHADRLVHRIPPAALGRERLGHFSLFHDRHRDDFWPATCRWLKDHDNPWPDATHLPAD